jgi:hypothetical protein
LTKYVSAGKKLGEKSSMGKPENWFGEAFISALSVGGVLVLIGIVWVTNPNLYGNIVNFFKDITNTQVSGTSIFSPVPAVPSAHAALYTAVGQFDLGVGILQVVILVALLIVQSRIRRIAEAAGSLVFWFGASYLTQTFLNSTTTQKMWFQFWSAIIILYGVSLIVRAMVFLAKSHQVKNLGKSD